jgi:hypothetical protein
VRELLASTNKEYYLVMDKLKRVVASGNFHHELIPRHHLSTGSTENTLTIIDEIPSCCRITLKGNEAPLAVSILYLSRAAGDLKVYISQKYAEPGLNHNEGAYSNPKKIVVQGEKGSSTFSHPYLYLTFTSLSGCLVKVLPSFSNSHKAKRAALKPITPGQPGELTTQANTGLPDIMSLLFQASAKTGGGALTSAMRSKGLDPQRVKQDIQRALADPTLSKDLEALADEILDRKRQKKTGGAGRNLVRLNAKAMGFWKEYERQKNVHLSEVREQMIQRAFQRKESMEVQEREAKQLNSKRWDIFK